MNPRGPAAGALHNPTFSGRTGEDVFLYLKQCRVAWAGVEFKDEADKLEAVATTVLSGLQGVALQYARSLPGDERFDLKVLSDRLKARFPGAKEEDRFGEAVKVFRSLKQGSLSVAEYGEKTVDVAHLVPQELQKFFVDRFLEGLNDNTLRIVLKGAISSGRAASNDYTIYEAVKLAFDVQSSARNVDCGDEDK